MKLNKLRLLYVPNEDGEFRQLGFRRPLANLLGAGLIDDLSVFSLQWRIRNGGDPEDHRQDLIRRVRDFKPSMILMQHLGTTGLRDMHFSQMRSLGDFDLIYHEADPYSRLIHPLPRSARAAGRAADVVFTVGSGTFTNNFKIAGATDVRWAPSPFEPERFNVGGNDSLVRDYDVVVVANRNRPRLRGLPNWKDRIGFIEHLQSRFGDRLGIYGNGWTGVGALGPVDFSRQNEAIRSGWISANWDHFASESKYFSNRLPISLAAGSIHATTRHPGYDEIFPDNTRDFLILGESHEQLGSSIEHVLSTTTPEQRVLASRSAQEFAHSNFRQDDQMVRFINFREKLVDPTVATRVWDTSAVPVSEL